MATRLGTSDDARVDALSRDLAVLATSHALVVGRSQFSVLAALLQRPDGVHVTTGPKQLVDASGCHYFANTLVVGRHTDAATGEKIGCVDMSYQYRQKPS